MINSTYVDGNFQDFSGNISKINNNNNSELAGHYLYRKFQPTPDSTDFSNSSSTTGIPILDPNFTNFNVKDYVSIYLGPQRNTFPIVVSLTVIYTTIFLTGLMGNLFTCVVILKNFYMRTVTNYYLASLAVSDLLTLTFGKWILFLNNTINFIVHNIMVSK